MKKLTSKMLLAFLGAAATGLVAYADPILSPTSVPITSDSQILNLTPVFAYSVFDNIANDVNGGGNFTTTVNGVTFQGYTSVSGINFSTNIGFNYDDNGINSNYGGIVSTTLPDISPDLATTLRGDFWNPSSATLTFSGLTPDTTYTLQLFAGFNWQTGTENVTDGTSTGLLSYGSPRDTNISGQAYILDTFIAPANGIETLTLTGLTTDYSFGNDGPLIDFSAVNLELGAPVVPEPSTWAMLLGGVLVLGWVLRRKTVRAL